jgi:farnesyl diphosphate synthase
MTKSSQAEVQAALSETASFMEDMLDRLLPVANGPEGRVIEAMRYAALGGGKRIRAFLALQSGRLFGVERRAMGRAAAAIECMHAYSLIHDDLPAMDDDAIRRGRPATHKAFGEATAILAGDALQALAFEILAAPETHQDPHLRCELVARLAHAAGCHGMVGGQMIDMSEKPETGDIGYVTRAERMKTGALIAFSCDAGAVMGKASPQMRHALAGFAQELGLAFQIADDLLDAEGIAIETGKATRKDSGQGKTTFVSILGVERAREQAQLLAAQAALYLDLFDEKADLLRGITDFTVARRL